MAYRVFYSWQSTNCPKYNRSFIRGALERALKSFPDDGDLTEPVRLDSDTADVPGTPDIAATIFEKIKSASVFVADVTFVDTVTGEDGETDGLSNPNVLLELGFAAATIGWERVILVRNKGVERGGEYPFDLRGRRWPITFDLSEANNDNKADIHAQLVERLRVALKTALRSAAAVQEPVDEDAVVIERTTTEATALRERLLSGGTKVDPSQGVFAITVAALRPLSSVDWRAVHDRLRLLRPPGAGGWDHETFGDGLVNFSLVAKKTPSFIEMRGDGVVRAANTTVVAGHPWAKATWRSGIPSLGLVGIAAETVVGSLVALKDLGAGEVFGISIALLNLKDARLDTGQYEFGFLESLKRKTGNVDPPPIALRVERGVDENEVVTALKPAFDFVWREFGYPGCMHFDGSGAWRG